MGTRKLNQGAAIEQYSPGSRGRFVSSPVAHPVDPKNRRRNDEFRETTTSEEFGVSADVHASAKSTGRPSEINRVAKHRGAGCLKSMSRKSMSRLCPLNAISLLILLLVALPNTSMGQIDTADLFDTNHRFTAGGSSDTVGSIEAGDLDSDGNIDLVAAHGVLTVSMGRGDGTFDAPREETVVSGARALAIADLDSDGVADIVAAGDRVLHVLKGSGDGTFQSLAELEIPNQFNRFDSLQSLAVDDMGADGTLEILVGNFWDDEVELVGFDSSGNLNVEGSLEVQQPRDVATGDVNGDGLKDIVVAETTTSENLFINLGDDAFEQREIAGNVNVINSLTVTFEDVNEDGALDILAGSAITKNGAVVAYGLGDGGFVAERGNLFTEDPDPGVIGMNGVPNEMIARDLAGNESRDIVMPTISAGLAVAGNLGNGSFQDARAFATDGNTRDAAVGDFDNDGDLDVAALNLPLFANPSIELFLNDGTGSLKAARFMDPSQNQTMLDGRRNNAALSVGDLDQDGLPDIIGSSGDAFISNLNGGLDAPKFQGSPWALVDWSDGSGRAVDLLDFNGDVLLDVVRASWFPFSLDNPCPILDSAVDMATSNSSGLEAVDSIDLEEFNLIGPVDLVVADYDSDGRDDIVVASNDFCDDATPGKLSILFGEGGQEFSNPNFIAEAEDPAAVVSGDLDGDDDIDLVYADSELNAVRVHLNNGDGTFAPFVEYPAGEAPLRIALDDIDGDGLPDIVTANPATGTVTVLLNAGSGNLGPPSSFAAGPNPGRLVLLDLDGDGNRDIATLSRPDRQAGQHRNVHVLRGAGDGTFAAPVAFLTASSGQALVAGDFTGDGLPDLATSHSQDIRGVAIMENRRPDRTIPEIEVRFDGTLVPDEAVIPALEQGTDYGTALADAGVKSRTFEIANLAPPSLELTATPAVRITGTNPSQFVITEQPPNPQIAPGESGEFTIEFRPDSPGTKRAVVEIRNSDIGEDPYTFTISGAGIVKPEQLDLFATPIPSLDVGTDNDAIVASDFNADGIPDVATISTDEAALYVHRNDGAAVFQLVQTLETPTNPIRIVALDLNQDGREDLAVLTRAFMDSSLATFLTQSDGTLEPDQTLQVDNGPANLVVGDMDGDGFADIAIANERADTLNLLFGTGGGLQAAEIIALPVDSAPSSVAMADFNTDGAVDLAFGSTERRDIGILFADGNAGFENPAPVTLETRAFVLDGMVVLDADVDGIPDLLVQNKVHFSNGDGTFSPDLGMETDVNAGSEAQTVDMDLDEIPDVAGANSVFQEIGVAIPAAGLRKSAAHLQPTGFFAINTSTAVGDFNQDGVPDLASARDRALFASLGRGDGVLYAPRNLAFMGSGAGYFIDDFNDDGRSDIINASAIAFAAPQEEFEPALEFFPEIGIGVVDIAHSRLGSSGELKIYAADRQTGDASVIVPEIRSLTPEVRVPLSRVTRIPTLNEAPDTISVGDVNGDGVADFATAQKEENTISLHVGIAEDEFEAPSALTITGATDEDFGPPNVVIEFADLNLDGNDDLVASHSGPPLDEIPDNVFVFISNGDGSFQPKQEIGVGNEPFDMVVRDFGNDSIPDIAVTNIRDGTIAILDGNGDGGFAPPRFLDVAVLPPNPTNPTRVFDLAAADFNGDGAVDLVASVVDSLTHSVLLRGDGAGNFSLPIFFKAFGEHERIELDGNGVPDLMLSANVGVLNMTSPPPPVPRFEISAQGRAITNGDSEPSTEDGTDFGVRELGNTLVREFEILNSGTSSLEIADIAIAGAAAADFDIALAPPSSIAPQEQATVEIEFSATNIGQRAAQIVIEHNDSDLSPFAFSIQGEGVDPTGELLFKDGFE
jgi:hypothetical protein